MAYRLSFGSNRLLVSETTQLVSNFLETNDWDETKSFGIDKNVVNYPHLHRWGELFMKCVFGLKALPKRS